MRALAYLSCATLVLPAVGWAVFFEAVARVADTGTLGALLGARWIVPPGSTGPPRNRSSVGA